MMQTVSQIGDLRNLTWYLTAAFFLNVSNMPANTQIIELDSLISVHLRGKSLS